MLFSASEKGAVMQTMYQKMSDAELADALVDLRAQVAEVKSRGLKLDMARGKPSPEQVGISRPMLDLLSSTADLTDEGVDCSNYGCFEGIPSARRLAGEFLGVPAEQTIVLGSSSLNIMQDVIVHYWEKGIPGHTPWHKLDTVKWLCPSPGYDRHFGLTEDLGIQNIPVRMIETGPDMDEVERLVASDPSIKGMFCVPKYSNPTGVTYSDETVRRLATMECAAPDFRIVWDDAYAVHDFGEKPEKLANIFDYAREVGNEDRILAVASTSKITFPGAGIAFFGSSPANVAEVARTLMVGLISANKLNQLMHVRFLPTLDAVRAHMREARGVPAPALRVRAAQARGGAGRHRVRHVDASERRLLRELRRSRGLRQARGRPVQGHGRHHDPGGCHLALWRGPARHEHPHRAQLPERRRALRGPGRARSRGQAGERGAGERGARR